MKKKYFNIKTRRKAKSNLKRTPGRKYKFSKRMGGVIGSSVILENRNINANDLSGDKKKI